MIKKYQKKLSHREMQNYNLKKAQVSGEFIISILNGLHDFKNEALKLLEKYGIKDPKKEEWHSFKLWLKVIEELGKEIGPTRLYILGTTFLENNEMLNHYDLEKGLNFISGIYRKNHKDGNIGAFKLINFNNENREAEMMSDTPYPCDFERGIIMYVANKFNPKNNKNLLVVHKDLKTCRKRGIDYCIYLIKW